MDEKDGQWLGTAEAAHRLGLVPRTLYKLIDAGELPAYWFGQVIRLRRSDVDDFIERSRIPPGTLEHLHPELSRDRDADAGDEDER